MDVLEALNIFSWAMIFVSVPVAISVSIYPAPYGKHSSNDKSNYSLNPKAAWLIQESPSFFVPIFCIWIYAKQGKFDSIPTPNLILLLCFAIHYFQRSFIYSLKIKSTKPVPINICLMAFCFCFFNGFLQSLYLLEEHYTNDWIYHVNFIIGVLLFAAGMAINIHSDTILINLRSPDQNYKIPRGGLFEYVSGANYIGEIIEWLGYAIASLSIPSLAFLIFTISNVAPRAKQHHMWYVKKFANYPDQRKSLIPFLW